jgi:hypothetical protein
MRKYEFAEVIDPGVDDGEEGVFGVRFGDLVASENFGHGC